MTRKEINKQERKKRKMSKEKKNSKKKKRKKEKGDNKERHKTALEEEIKTGLTVCTLRRVLGRIFHKGL